MKTIPDKVGGTLALRLPEQYGIVQKEYVEVPDSLFRKPSELSECLAASLAYVRTLKPKTSKRKK